MPPGKMPPGKVPPGKFPLEISPPGKFAHPKMASQENRPPPKKKNFVKLPHVIEYFKGENFVNFNFRQS